MMVMSLSYAKIVNNKSIIHIYREERSATEADYHPTNKALMCLDCADTIVLGQIPHFHLRNSNCKCAAITLRQYFCNHNDVTAKMSSKCKDGSFMYILKIANLIVCLPLRHMRQTAEWKGSWSAWPCSWQHLYVHPEKPEKVWQVLARA